jgi:hypothetical protein
MRGFRYENQEHEAESSLFTNDRNSESSIFMKMLTWGL